MRWFPNRNRRGFEALPRKDSCEGDFHRVPLTGSGARPLVWWWCTHSPHNPGDLGASLGCTLPNSQDELTPLGPPELAGSSLCLHYPQPRMETPG